MNANISILIKPNSRLILENINHDSFVFRMDKGRTASFFSITKFAHQYISAFLKNGKLIEELLQIDKIAPDDSSKSRIMMFIDNLKRHGFIEYHFLLDDVNHITISPLSKFFQHNLVYAHALSTSLDRYSISRFAYFHYEGDRMTLESPLVPFKVNFSIPIFSKFLPYLNGKILSSYDNHLSLEAHKLLEILINICIGHGLIKPIDEPEPQTQRYWEFHDLLFHHTSRRGRFDDTMRFGATYRFSNDMPPPTTFKSMLHSDAITLYKPNLNEIELKDLALTSVLERRRTGREFHLSEGLTISELGEFLFRSIAIRSVVKTHTQDAIYKVYPAPGAIHEIEFYLVVGACEGLESDIYYYHPLEHALYRKHAEKHKFEDIIFKAKASMGSNAKLPHVVFVLTSKFEKITWKYEKMSYRSTLVTMGAIFQTMSLVATAMDIGSCIIGAGDSSTFAQALDLDPMEENAIGEFAIGRLS